MGCGLHAYNDVKKYIIPLLIRLNKLYANIAQYFLTANMILRLYSI